MKLSGQALTADSLLSWEVTTPHMAIDVTNLHSSEESDPQLIALLERILVRLDEQAQFQALLAEAIKLLIQGRWDAAQYGPRSVEALLVAYNPANQGKVDPIPFPRACRKDPVCA